MNSHNNDESMTEQPVQAAQAGDAETPQPLAPQDAEKECTEAAAPSPKRSFRFLVIYIVLLFSVSSVFLVAAFFVDQNNDIKTQYGKTVIELEQLQAEKDTLERDTAAAIEALTTERDELQALTTKDAAAIEQKDSHIEDLNTTILVLNEQMAALQQQIAELQAQLAQLTQPQPDPDEPTATIEVHAP